MTLTGRRFMVTRNPSLHPGDLQKFNVMDKPEFPHLIDCIVFSIRGKRPSADMMPGLDHDGDKWELQVFYATQVLLPILVSDHR